MRADGTAVIPAEGRVRVLEQRADGVARGGVRAAARSVVNFGEFAFASESGQTMARVAAMPSAMTFQITALSTAPFAPLFALSDESLAAKQACVASLPQSRIPLPRLPLRRRTGRHAASRQLRASAVHSPVPLVARHLRRHGSAQALRARESSRRCALGSCPSVRSTVRECSSMPMSLRGRSSESVIRRLLDAPGAAYLHVHFARQGCYIARVDRR